MVTLLITESKLGHRDKNFEQEVQELLFGSDWVRLELFLADFKQVMEPHGLSPWYLHKNTLLRPWAPKRSGA
jgi:hypothetical protein